VLSVGAAAFAEHTGDMGNSHAVPHAVAGPRTTRASFDIVVLPHLDAAHRLARWLMRDADVAEDVVQEASLRAFRHFRTFVGGDGRAWFLRIVRNTCYGWRRDPYQRPTDPFDEEQHSSARPQSDPETLLLQNDDARLIREALGRLPDHFHQILVLRELEGLSYRELADVIGIPVGTVMSRLSRAREALRRGLDPERQPSTSSRLLPITEWRRAFRFVPHSAGAQGAAVSGVTGDSCLAAQATS
jgi:RNA polymerase sigma-70 factor (ECF subfamily)